MSYVPPFKRASSDKGKPSPVPESLDLELNKKTRPGMSSAGRLLYADRSTFRWFPVGLSGEGLIPSYVKLEPNTQLPFGNSFALVNVRQSEAVSEKDLPEESPWEFVAEKVLPDLLTAFENVKNSIEIDDRVKMKPKLVARLGKVHFRQMAQDIGRMEESDMRNLKRIFHTDLSRSYNDIISRKFSSMHGFTSQDKNSFLIRLRDDANPNMTISCKCWEIAGSGNLQLGKIYMNDIRQLVVDVSCLNENLDLRLLLSIRGLAKLTDDEVEGIGGIISSAVIDSRARSFASSSFRLKLRHVERFNFETSVGESTEETSLMIKGLAPELQGQIAEAEEILKNLSANLKFIWENFFSPELFSI